MGSAPAAWSADVSMIHSVQTSLTYTDNVDLDPDDEAEDAIIWTNTGATSIRATGARAEAALDAALSLDTEFADDTDVEVRPNARGIGTVELLQSHLFVDGQASAFLALENPFSAVSTSPGSGRDDLSEVYTVGVSPYWIQGFGNWANSELRYRHNRTYFRDNDDDGDDGTDSTITNAASLRTVTGSRFARIQLGNDLEYENVESDGRDGDLERKTALLSGQYALTRWFLPVGTVGYEKIESDDLRDDPEGLVWNAGFIARPGPRSELEFRYGERYEEQNIFASARYLISPRLTFQASYTEVLDITGAAIGRQAFNLTVDEQGRLIDPATGLPVEDIDDFLGLEDEAFLAHRFQASLSGSYERSDFVLAAVYEERDFDFRPDEKLLTASARWTYALTPDTRLGVLGGYRTAETDVSGGLDTETVLGRLQLTHNLAQNLQALAAYSYAQRFADDENDEYTENAVTLGLRVTF